MEQVSPDKSPTASSNQRNKNENLDYEKEPSSRVTEASENRPTNLELLAALQSKQTQQIGASFSGAPLMGGLLAQFNGANEDHSAVYMQSNPQLYDQQLYNIPLSHLHKELSLLASSSRLQGQYIGPSSVDVNTHRKSTMLQTPVLPLRPMMYQGNHNPMNPGFDLGSGSSRYGKGPAVSSSSLKRKTIWEDDKSPNYQSWSGRGYQRYSSSNLDIDGGRYTLYDKRYEAIGLPVDPHLRIFNALNGNGNGESSSKK